MTQRFSEMQLDALRELANIASGTAATALSQMLGREIELSVPRALALPLADAVDAAGDPGATVKAVALPLDGDIEGLVLLLIPVTSGATLCQMLGVEPGSEVGDSALCEIGNILGTSYLNALASMTGLSLMPCAAAPRRPTCSEPSSHPLIAQTAGHGDTVLVLDSELDVAGEPCSISFMLLPNEGGIHDLSGSARPRGSHSLEPMENVRMGEMVVSRDPAMSSARSGSAPASASL